MIDQLEHDKDRIIQQLLWHYRHHEPNLCVRITEQDIAALDQCLEYNKQKAGLKYTRSGPALFVVMVDQQSNAIVPVENNVDDFEKGELTRRKRAVREGIEQLAGRVKNAAAMGEFSMSEVTDLADAALLLAK